MKTARIMTDENCAPAELAVLQDLKKTEIGWIPKDWEVDKLKDLIILTSGQHLSPGEYNKENNGTPYFTGPTDYTNDSSAVTKHTTLSTKEAKTGDILITVKGSGVGKLFFLELPKAALGRQLMAICGKRISNPYLYYVLIRKSPKFQKLASGNMIPGLSRKDILSTEVAYPSLKEQRSIANCLLLWDRAIENLQRLIKEKEIRKKGLMQQLLSGKKRLPGFSKDWQEKRIKDIAQEVSIKNSNDDDVEVLSCTKYNGLVPSLKYFGRKVYSDDTSNYKVVPNGHFAYATNHIEEGSIGYQSELDRGLVSPMYTVFKTDKAIDDQFLYSVLKSHRLIHEYNSHMEGSINRRGGLRWKAFSSIKIKIPEQKEQTAIAKVFQSANKEINLLKEKLEKLKTQKKGLMKVLLTGKKRIKA